MRKGVTTHQEPRHASAEQPEAVVPEENQVPWLLQLVLPLLRLHLSELRGLLRHDSVGKDASKQGNGETDGQPVVEDDVLWGSNDALVGGGEGEEEENHVSGVGAQAL